MPDVAAAASVLPPEACYKILGLCISNKIDLGLIATVVFFFLGFYLNKKADARKNRETRRHYLIALREEIGLNILQLDKMIRKMPQLHEFSEFNRRDKNNRLVITFTFLSVIFKNRTEIIQDLPDTLIKNIVDFYGRLEEIGTDCKIFESVAYPTVSFEGREAVFSAIVTDLEVALQHGRTMKDAIVLHLNEAYSGTVI